jgi:hypothetical protein
MNPKSTKKLLTKIIEMDYGFPGKLMRGWEAERLAGGDTVRVKRSNGTFRDFQLDQHVTLHDKSVVIPKIDETGVLIMGEWSVLIGKGIQHEMSARKKGASAMKAYLLIGPDGRSFAEVKLGTDHEGQSVSLLDSHLLKVGENIYPVMPKKRDVTLKVLDSEFNGGKLAYINLHIPGMADTRRNAPPTAFFRPSRAGEPAQVKEVVAGKLVTTALFQLASTGKSVKYSFRTGETALIDLQLTHELNKAREVARNAAIEPEEYHVYMEISQKLIENHKKWITGSMAIDNGVEWFKPATPEIKRESDGPQP